MKDRARNPAKRVGRSREGLGAYDLNAEVGKAVNADESDANAHSMQGNKSAGSFQEFEIRAARSCGHSFAR